MSRNSIAGVSTGANPKRSNTLTSVRRRSFRGRSSDGSRSRVPLNRRGSTLGMDSADEEKVKSRREPYHAADFSPFSRAAGGLTRFRTRAYDPPPPVDPASTHPKPLEE